MTSPRDYMEKILSGEAITKEDALNLYNSPLDELCQCADEIRKHFCENKFDICTIINAKSGKCSENCKYCAQSSFYSTCVQEYPLLSPQEVAKQAKENFERGVLRFSIVTSGKKLSDSEVEKVCEIIKAIKNECDIKVCISCGLLNKEQFSKLKEAGASRVHNNLETSEKNFSNVCTTHSFQDKVNAIKSAQSSGLSVCSGGIMGIGETPEDRIDMAFSLKELGIKSIPINMLNPIKGTPYENLSPLTEDDMRRIAAVYRFILPDASIRLAGGRGLMEHKGYDCFKSGANATISGDMLTTAGITIKKDIETIEALGYERGLCNG